MSNVVLLIEKSVVQCVDLCVVFSSTSFYSFFLTSAKRFSLIHAIAHTPNIQMLKNKSVAIERITNKFAGVCVLCVRRMKEEEEKTRNKE